MSGAVTVTLSEVTPALRAQVMALAPLPEQEPFSGAARDTLPAAELTPGRVGVVAMAGDVPFGFLMLDVGPEVRVYAPGDGVVGVRGVYVDAASQGRGLGTEMLRALPPFARERYPDATHLALTVNTSNPRAIRVYLRAGFTDTGRLYYGGRLGPQHVLELAL
jgi:RimJ/RimL family protein N-acetyltransferase